MTHLALVNGFSSFYPRLYTSLQAAVLCSVHGEDACTLPWGAQMQITDSASPAPGLLSLLTMEELHGWGLKSCGGLGLCFGGCSP